jgi:hypothetical protein
MMQDIIVYFLILLAAAKAIFSFIKLFIPLEAIKKTACEGCVGCHYSKLKEKQSISL